MIVSPYYSSTAFAVFTPLAVVYSLVTHLWVRLRGGGGGGHDSLTPLPPPQPHHRHQVAIVTGSNTGIGLETARSLAIDYGMTVVLACRSREKGLRAVQKINDADRKDGSGTTGNAVFVHPLDLSSSQSIRDFCQAMQKKFDKVHVLVNNAGRNTSSDRPVPGTKRDLLFQTNFLGHFELTARLLPLLAARARIVNLASVMHHFVPGDVHRAAFWKHCIAHHDRSPVATYAPSKLAAVLFTMELNRRYADRLQSVAVNPGGVCVLKKSSRLLAIVLACRVPVLLVLFRSPTFFLLWLYRNSDIWRSFPRFVIPLFRLVYLNNKQGCQTSVAAAVCDWKSLQFPNQHAASADSSSSSSPNAVYLQPYKQFISLSKEDEPLFPIPEMLGVFGGHLKARPRLPREDGGLKAAQSLVSR